MNSLNITLGNYNNSMNFVFGLTGINDEKLEAPGEKHHGQKFDILNNPYVEVLGYEMYTPPGGNGQVLRHKYEISACTEDFKARFMPPHTMGWYD